MDQEGAIVAIARTDFIPPRLHDADTVGFATVPGRRSVELDRLFLRLLLRRAIVQVAADIGEAGAQHGIEGGIVRGATFIGALNSPSTCAA